MVLAVLTSFDGGRLFGQVHGSGAPVVVALHGWARDHGDFDLVLGGAAARNGALNAAVAPHDSPGLARSADDSPLPDGPLPSIALDLPGFGGTPAPEHAWGSPEYGDAVGRLLEELDRPVVLVGHSFGGRVAVQVAATQPGAVRGLVLTGAPLFPASSDAGRRRPPARYRLARALARSGLVGEERLEALRQRYGSPDYRAATGVMREVLVRAIAEEREEAYSAPLGAVTAPVELVWGELDTAAPPQVAERIVAHLSAPVELSVLPGVGHLTPLVAPGRLRQVIERLLAASGGRVEGL